MTGYITKEEFRALLDLFMCSDPWPLEDSANTIIEKFLDRTALSYNLPTWIDAYHSKEILTPLASRKHTRIFALTPAHLDELLRRRLARADALAPRTTSTPTAASKGDRSSGR